MIRPLKNFFYPPTLVYSYNQPKDIVLVKINEVLKKKVALLSGNDMKGRFLNHNTFAIDIVSLAFTGGVQFSSTLIGKVTESKKGITQIKTKAKPSIAYYVLFFVTIIAGLAYFYKSIQTGSTESLLWPFAAIILGPVMAVGLSNIAIASIYERYRLHIDKELNIST